MTSLFSFENMDLVIIKINNSKNTCSTIIDDTLTIEKLLETYLTSQLDAISSKQDVKDITIIQIL
jgi:hypothetical protein|tara:strand:+ start:286 stop:480 length:195 start_codon:yes stop_codon:yes gene_type:complete